MAAAPRPQQPPPQSGGNVNLQPGGGCAGAGAGGGGQQQPQGPAAPGGQEAAGPAELSRPQHYTIPGILHYIQHEWARFEMERAHWEVERAERDERSIAIRTHAAYDSWYWTLWLLWVPFVIALVLGELVWMVITPVVLVLHCAFYMFHLYRWSKKL